MANFKDLAARMSAKINSSIEGVSGELGSLNSNGTYTVMVPGRPNYDYVRLYGADNNVVEALNTVTAKQPRLPVFVRKISGDWVVTGVDSAGATQIYGEAAGAMNYPPTAVSPNFLVSSDKVIPGRVRPFDGTDLQIYIEPFACGDLELGGVSFDLATVAATITSGKKAPIIISVNKDTNEITATKGTEVGLPPSMVVTRAVALAVVVPTTDIKLWCYVIAEGDTTLPTATDRIYDLRNWFQLDTGGTMSSFTVQGDSGSTDVTDGKTLYIDSTATSGITTTAQPVGVGGDARVSFALNISGMTEDTTPDLAADFVVTYDASASLHKKVKLNNLPSSTDTDAVHVNVAGEIAAITQKVTPAADDKIIIEDSAASDAKKYVRIADLPYSSGVAWTGSVYLADAVPASPNAEDDEFKDDSAGVPTGWTEMDFASSTTVTESTIDGGVYLQQTTHTGNALAAIYKAIPAGDFTMWTRVSLAGISSSSQYNQAGFVLLQDGTSNTGDMCEFVITRVNPSSVNIEVITLTAYNSAGTNLASIAGATSTVSPSVILRLRRNSTTYYFDVSEDGVGWWQIYSGTLAFTPTHIGLSINNSNTGADARSTFRYFRYTGSDVGMLHVLRGQMINYYAP